MHRLVLSISSILLVVVRTTPAQTVRGQLTDSVSHAPIPGTFLTLVDQHGTERARAISNQNGAFALTAPANGTYRLRSKRIGFRPFVSAAITLDSAEAKIHNIAIDPIPIVLEEIVVAGERKCDVEAGSAVTALWDEIREALAAVAWTSKSPGYWYQIIQYQRQLSASGAKLGDDSTWHEVGYQTVPFKSAPAEQLDENGYVVVDYDGWTYFSPDADVLLSETFLHTHCFETRIGSGETDSLVGLAFTPAHGRRLPDVTGTLWVNRRTAELHHLEFRYSKLPERVTEPRAGGRVDFMRMPTGGWIVSEWMIRMPIAEKRRRSVAEGGGEAFPTVVGFIERGGNASEIKTTSGAVVYSTLPPPAPPPAPAPAPAVAAEPQPVLDTAVVVPQPRRGRPSVATVNGPAPGTREHRSENYDRLTSEEFSGTNITDGFTLVQHYRPNWLMGRGPLSIMDQSAGQVQVYLNNSLWGDLTRLREIPATDILEMRLLRGPDATTKYGVNHSGGVIEVVTH